MKTRTRIGLAAALALAAGCGGSGGAAHDGSGGAGAGSGSSGSGCTGSLCNVDPSCGKDDPTHMGDGTYYAADGSGNCSFEPTGDLMVGAMNHVDYAGSAACGACVDVVGPQGEITIRVVDQCPECQEGDIDLSPEAFQQLAPLDQGRIPITWHYVACDVSGPITYHFKEGSNAYWTAVQIRGSRYAIATVEAKKQDGTFSALERQDYDYFVDASGLGEGPYAFRVTDVYGQVLEDDAVPFAPAGDSPGAAQFPPCGQ